MNAATRRQKAALPENQAPHRPPQHDDSAPAPPRSELVFYGVSILLGGFLLFLVELMMGKFVLPRFGGGPSVWSTSLLVFQVLLLAGYGYAALLSARFNPRLQGIIHLSLLAASALAIALLAILWRSPVLPGAHWKSSATANPVWQISLLLVSAVGIECILLSATSPLFQNWFSRRRQKSPYRLYALSNLGSMLGVLAYPFLVEPALPLSKQAWIWTAAYVLFLLAAAACAYLQIRRPVEPEPQSRKPARRQKSAPAGPRVLWLALAACSSTLLLATTNLLGQQIAPVPLLWVLPLSLYLLSFIICFDHPRWYRREIFYPLYALFALAPLKVLPHFQELPITWLIVIFCSALMAVCMACHGELARLKPSPRHLTSFYLMVSAGGALGSLFVVLIAPRLFSRFWEFQISLLGCGVLLIVAVLRDSNSWVYRLRFGGVILLAGAVFMIVSAYHFTNELLVWEEEGATVVARTRNFFGVKTVLQVGGMTALIHGHTLHGIQVSDPALRNEPTSYYNRDTGIGLLLDRFPRLAGQPGLRVGVIGMGVGTLAAYGQSGDYFRFYEIDPAVPPFSLGENPVFTFVHYSPARVDVVEGDARVVMQEEVSRGEFQKFDVLVVDAFSGDAVPVHLLTREAMDLYSTELRGPQSVVAFHLSSSVLDLRPVIANLARTFGLASVEVDTPPDLQPVWILLSRDPGAFQQPKLAAQAHAVTVTHTVKPWTDDFSNLYQLFHW